MWDSVGRLQRLMWADCKDSCGQVAPCTWAYWAYKLFFL